ncbi:hypothetical protein P7C73_g3783, partial [Tremellales sp. Uapishka_1]
MSQQSPPDTLNSATYLPSSTPMDPLFPPPPETASPQSPFLPIHPEDDAHLRRRETNRQASTRLRFKKASVQSALEYTCVSMEAENDRLRSIIACLENGVDDELMNGRTLGELANAAISGSGFAGFESLSEHLLHDSGETSRATGFDYTQGLVSSITLLEPKDVRVSPCDPFEITRLALLSDIEETKQQILEKEREIRDFNNGATDVSSLAAASSSLSQKEVEGRIKTTDEGIATLDMELGVLRDINLRFQTEVRTLRLEETGAGLQDAGDADEEVLGALIDVRRYIEDLLKIWKEKGTLPTAPLISLPPLLLPTPPATVPKKRGRPPRSISRHSILPPALRHLVPDDETVKTRGEETPIRRKGVKRSRDALEREKKREEEENEILRGLVGVGHDRVATAVRQMYLS